MAVLKERKETAYAGLHGSAIMTLPRHPYRHPKSPQPLPPNRTFPRPSPLGYNPPHSYPAPASPCAINASPYMESSRPPAPSALHRRLPSTMTPQAPGMSPHFQRPPSHHPQTAVS